MKRIGLTGGIASGKSLIVSMLRREQIPVIDADELARNVVSVGTPGLEAVIERFGKDYLLPDGSLDRKKLGDTIFKDQQARTDLERITHPLIGKAMADVFAKLEQEGHKACVYCAPLLFEKNLDKHFDAVILVYCDEKTQMQRLANRDGLTLSESLRRIQTQMPLAEKKSKTAYQIDNSGTPEESNKQLSDIWHRITN